ncbi:MAG: hypothetical protein J2P48_01555 [Alphaproteobacteria bacterium]|nr:hypothetical protein [Alphaproteobacteria bacterium]
MAGLVTTPVTDMRARGKFPSNNEFADWLIRHRIGYNKNDRVALIGMGNHPDATRTVLQHTERRSYRLIWEREISPLIDRDHFPSVGKTETGEISDTVH